MAEKHWVCSNCGSISSRSISGGVVCAKCGANFPNIAENVDITNQLTKLINTGKTEQIGIFRKNLRKELGNQLVNSADVLAWCDKLKEIYPEDYLAGFYTAYFKKEVENAEYKNYLKDFDCRIVYEPNVFLKEAMAFAIKHVDATTKDLTNDFIEKICEQVNSHLVEGETKLICEDFKKQVNGRLEQLETEMDLFADIERKVFICYVSEDLTIAKEVYKYLTEGENISCFLSDYNLPKTWAIGNADYWKRIESQIKQANVFLVISSNLLEHKINNGALKEIAFAKTQAHLARLEYKVDNSTENLCEKRTQNLIGFFDGKTWIKREGKDNGLRTLALAVSSELEASRHATNTEKRNTKPQSTTKENVVKAEAVATMQPTNIAKPTVSANSAQKQSNSLTHLEISYGTTKIKRDAYKGNKKITSVTIPASVTEIGMSAFESCSKLTSVTIPASVTEIGNGAFFGCNSLTSVTFEVGSKLTSIGIWAFYDCKFTSVIIPARVTEIGWNAFSGCSNLTSVTFEAGSKLTKIGSRTFVDCKSLTSVTIPARVTKIGGGAFVGCSKLTSISFAEGNNSYKFIDGNVYSKDGSKLVCYLASKTATNFAISSSVTTVGEEAFGGCNSLTSVTIPSSVMIIDDRAFDGCNSLTSITIPNSVTSIGNLAFAGCRKLTIYAEAPSKPAGWVRKLFSSNWNPDKCPVVWGSSGK